MRVAWVVAGVSEREVRGLTEGSAAQWRCGGRRGGAAARTNGGHGRERGRWRVVGRGGLKAIEISPVIGYDKAFAIAHAARPHPANSARNALDSGAITAEDFSRIRQPRHHVRTLLGKVIRKDITTAPSLAPAYWLPRHRRDWPGTADPPERGDRHDWARHAENPPGVAAPFDLKTSVSASRFPRSGPFLGPEPAVDVMALRSVHATAA